MLDTYGIRNSEVNMPLRNKSKQYPLKTINKFVFEHLIVLQNVIAEAKQDINYMIELISNIVLYYFNLDQH
jgi:hypothetical protein